MTTARITVPLRWRDLDVMGHVYQGVYHDLLEESRAAVLQPLGGGVGYPFVLAHVEVDHRCELRHSDGPVDVTLDVESIGDRRVVLRHRVERAGGELAASARSVIVAFDVDARRARSLTVGERDALEALRAPDDGVAPPARVAIGPDGDVALEVGLRWRDMNPMGHMDQGRFQELLDEARAAVFAPVTGPLGFPLVLARAEVDYRAEVARADERIVLRSGVEELGTRKVVLGHRLRLGDGRIVAEVRSTMVAFDREARTSRDLTPEERTLLAPGRRTPGAS